MEFLDRVFLDNTIRSFLFVFGLIILILLARKVISRFFASMICAVIKRAGGLIEKKSFIELIIRPLSWFIVILVAVFTIDRLNFPEAWRFTIYGVTLQTIFQKTGILLIIITFFRCLLKIVDFISIFLKQKAGNTKNKSDDQLIIFIGDFLKVMLIIAAIILIIKSGFNQDVGTLLTGLSIIGAALALAAKESIENIIASFIIFFDKPFYVGDFLKVNNVTGRVEKIGLRSTRIRTPEKTLVTVPNKQMVDSIVDNWSMRSHHRTEIKLEIPLHTDSNSIQSFVDDLKANLKKNNQVVQSNAFFSEYLKTGVIITVEYLSKTSSLQELNELRASFNMQFKRILELYHFDTPPPPVPAPAPEIKVDNKPPSPEPPKQQPLI